MFNISETTMTGTAQFSPCGRYRYSLTRTWSGGDICTFIMLNPSTADADKPDPTITRCMGFARGWGYGGLHVVNLFALRSTDPAALKTHSDPVGPENDDAILAAPRKLIVCAWGAHGGLRGREYAVMSMLSTKRILTHCLSTTKQGYPGHPLYLKSDAKPVEYCGR